MFFISNPPFRHQLAKRNDVPRFIIEHNLHIAIRFRHELGHHFAARAAWYSSVQTSSTLRILQQVASASGNQVDILIAVGIVNQ